MNSLIAQGFSMNKASALAGVSRSMLYYIKTPREQHFDPGSGGKDKISSRA